MTGSPGGCDRGTEGGASEYHHSRMRVSKRRHAPSDLMQQVSMKTVISKSKRASNTEQRPAGLVSSVTRSSTSVRRVCTRDVPRKSQASRCVATQ